MKKNFFQHIVIQNTQVVVFTSPRDEMQISFLNEQFGLKSEQIDKYRDEKIVPYGYLLIDTDNRLLYCANSGSLRSKLYVADRLKHVKSLADEHTRFFDFPRVPVVFLQMRKSFPSILLERFHQVSLRMLNKSVQKIPAKP